MTKDEGEKREQAGGKEKNLSEKTFLCSASLKQIINTNNPSLLIIPEEHQSVPSFCFNYNQQ